MRNENFFDLLVIRNDERELKEKSFFYTLGIENLNTNTYIVFNNKGEFNKTINVSTDFKQSIKEFETWLENNKLYSINMNLLQDREIEFYDLELKEQLKLLEWEFNNAGELVNTAW